MPTESAPRSAMPASRARAATVRSTALSRARLYPAIPHTREAHCRGMRRPARRGPSLPTSRGLRPDGSVGLVEDDLAVRDLRRILEDRLELLVAHPLGCDTSRLVGLRRGVEEADRAHDALAGVDQEVAAEAGQLAQARRQALVDL